MSNIISAVFDSEHDAQSAIEELQSVGISENAISVARQDAGDGQDRGDAGGRAEAGDAGKGFLTGAGIGAGVGALFGLAAVAIPGVGPFITAGALASALGTTAGGAAAGAIVGGASGGLAGALAHYGLNEAESQYYASEVEGGAVFVGVTLDGSGGDRDTVLDVIRRHNGRQHSGGQTGVVSDRDMQDFRSDSDRSNVWPYTRDYSDEELAGFTEDHRRYLRATDEERPGLNLGEKDQESLRLHEERLQATRRPVQDGEVTLRKEVVTENQTLNVPTTREEVVIERRPVTGQDATGMDDLQPGEEIRMPLMHEEVDVTKTAVATEEVNIGKRQVTDNQQVTDTVRREEARMDRSSDNLRVDVDEELSDDLTPTDMDRTRRAA